MTHCTTTAACMQVLLALPASHNVFAMHADPLEGAAADAAPCAPTPPALRDAVQFPGALFRRWLQAQTRLVLPISALSTEDMIQVPCSFLLFPFAIDMTAIFLFQLDRFLGCRRRIYWISRSRYSISLS